MSEQLFKPTNDASYDGRLPWLEGRRKRIGSSDARAILGCGYAGESATTVWAEKVHGVKRKFNAASMEAMNLGNELESAVINMFAKKHPEWKVTHGEKFATVECQEFTYLGSSLDGWAEMAGEKIVLEAKVVDAENAYEWRDEQVPLMYAVQVQHQLICTGWQRGVVIALVGGKYQERWLERDEALIEQMHIAYQRFWKHVIDRTPPEDAAPIAYEAVQSVREMGVAKMLGKDSSDLVRETLKLQDEADRIWNRLVRSRKQVADAGLGFEWLILDDQSVVRLGKKGLEKKNALPRGVRVK
jgi:putative phage-type endonuclease